ncbi:hypothetical protein WICPIJ_000512 [Wickerhamomyces pijperi]|uniref:Uncharacterized protein n=1 Tax=Wickerhamomyces pijperi TaxID=599730 RepID=A0A9P8QDF0_WICPI|nr:hypothetical protein WICPIJ_000512 [Wickerhamomyces pijperi]
MVEDLITQSGKVAAERLVVVAVVVDAVLELELVEVAAAAAVDTDLVPVLAGFAVAAVLASWSFVPIQTTSLEEWLVVGQLPETCSDVAGSSMASLHK